MKGLVFKTNKRTRFYILISVLFTCMILKHSLQVNIPAFALTVFLMAIAALGDKDEILAICICCIPLNTVVSYHYVVLACIAVYLIKYVNNVRVDLGFIPILLLILWEYLHCLSGRLDVVSLAVETIPYLLLLVLFFIRDVKSINYGFIVRIFSFTVLWTCLILVARLLLLSNFNFNLAFINIQRLGLSAEEVGDLVINPNTLGVQCVISVSCLIQLRMSGQKKNSDMLLMVLILILGALTVSRTYLACLLIMVFYLFVISKGGLKKKIKFLLGAIAILLISIVLITLLFPTVLELFTERLQIEDITSGRDSLFSEYNDYIFSSSKSMFWGVGVHDWRYKVENVYCIAEDVPHNGIQEILVAWGFPGLLLFCSIIFVLIWRSKQENPRQTMLNYLPFVILFAKIQVGQMITSVYTMLSFALVYLSLCADLNSDRIEK